MSDEEIIKHHLEDKYGIPFAVEKLTEKGEPCFYITPKNGGAEFFSIKVSFRKIEMNQFPDEHNVRITAEFIKQPHSVKFVYFIPKQPDEAKQKFINFASLLEKKGANLIVQVNGSEINTTSFKEWPSTWSMLSAKATTKPIEIMNETDYINAAKDFGSLMTGMFISFADIEENADTPIIGHEEGALIRYEGTRYERDRLNRMLCIENCGWRCKICGFDFKEKYGSLGEDFIEVHHIVPVSELGDNYVIDPVKDLIPVCSNCHAMLHRRSPPLKPEELKEILDEQKKNH